MIAYRPKTPSHVLIAYVVAALLAGASLPSAAQQPDEQRFSEQVEKDAREVGKSLRCVVCQNQSIENSNAPLAADMRDLVRERLAAGASRKEVIAFMTERYGNFVLMKPPLQLDTLLLWLGPLAFLIIAAFGWSSYLRPRQSTLVVPEPLSPDELARLETLTIRNPTE